MSKHTPGPWIFEYDNDVGENDDYFIEFFSVRSKDSNELIARVEEVADARLIAAAPDLLEALCKLADLYDAMGAPRGPCRIIADAAIAKATGEK